MSNEYDKTKRGRERKGKRRKQGAYMLTGSKVGGMWCASIGIPSPGISKIKKKEDKE